MAVAAKVRLKTITKWLLLLLTVAVWNCCAMPEVRRMDANRQQPTICQVAPHWTARVLDPDGTMGPLINPMLDARGKVVLVALTDASSGHSLVQAQKLQSLESYFKRIGMVDLTFILVNSIEARDQLSDIILEEQSVTIVQDEDNQTVWTKLAGKKDNIFVYDRCGRLNYAIPFPLSIIHPRQQLVESSVISTYLDDLCGQHHCHNRSSTADLTLDDSADTELINTTHSTLADVTQLLDVTVELALNESNQLVVFSDILENGTELVNPLPDDVGLDTDQNRSSTYFMQEPEPEEPEKVTTTAEPPGQGFLGSLYKTILNYMPWTKDKNAERRLNTVQRFLDKEENATEEEHQCNITSKRTCRAWTKKKLDQARICCNLHACNRSSQYLRKHCRHYPEDRCKKVQLVLRCCQANESQPKGRS